MLIKHPLGLAAQPITHPLAFTVIGSTGTHSGHKYITERAGQNLQWTLFIYPLGSFRQVQRQLRKCRSWDSDTCTMKERWKMGEGGGEGDRRGRERRREREQSLRLQCSCHSASRNNGHLENNGCRQSLGLFLSATVSPRQEELDFCPVRAAPTGSGLGGR